MERHVDHGRGVLDGPLACYVARQEDRDQPTVVARTSSHGDLPRVESPLGEQPDDTLGTLDLANEIPEQVPLFGPPSDLPFLYMRFKEEIAVDPKNPQRLECSTSFVVRGKLRVDVAGLRFDGQRRAHEDLARCRGDELATLVHHDRRVPDLLCVLGIRPDECGRHLHSGAACLRSPSLHDRLEPFRRRGCPPPARGQVDLDPWSTFTRLHRRMCPVRRSVGSL